MPIKFRSALLAVALLGSQAFITAGAADITLYLHDNTQADYPAQSHGLAMAEMDLWERIRKGYAIPDLDNKLVQTQTDWYSARPDYIHRTTTRASRYLYHVVEEIEKRNMPTELALLPFIESAFNPQAYSSAKAAGMWQFIPSTGRAYDLKQSDFKDERRDVLASTEAALNYLEKLYGMFGDWQLALAAYNWGEGSVQRAIKKNAAAGLPTDFNGLMRLMPAETQNYYPKLQAVKDIIARPAQYGVTLPRVDNEPYFVTIGKTRDIDIKLAAQLAELSVEEFKALNPQYNRPIIIGSVDTNILLPKNNAARFKENLANWRESLSSWTAHRVTGARVRIEAIAERFDTTPQVLREVNNIPPRMSLKAGSTILVPRSALTSQRDISAEVADNAIMHIVPDQAATRRITVKVGKRDSLASLARRHKVSAAQIREWNDLKSDKLASGSRLELHVPGRMTARGETTVAKRQTVRGERTKATQTASNRKAAPAAKPRVVASRKAAPARKPAKSTRVASK